MEKRLEKKFMTAFQMADCSGAVLLINLKDPQLETVKVFLQAIVNNNLRYFAVGNKMDTVSPEHVKEIKQEFIETMQGIPGIHRIWFTLSLKSDEGLEELKKSMDLKFGPGERVVILGVFNSGKTSLISKLTGETLITGDIPGKTQVFSEHRYNNLILIDSVGQVIDVNKPLMFSVDFSGCRNLDERIDRVFSEEIFGLKKSIKTAKEGIKEAIALLKKQLEDGKKIIVVGAGASALVAKEIAGQGTETGLPILVFTNEFAEFQPISFAKGYGEEEKGLARYIAHTVNAGDVIIGVSASGGTGFVFEALRLGKAKGSYGIAITENIDTPLGKAADVVIKSDAKPEGPSSSKIQTAHLVIGHTLILCLAEERGLTAQKCIDYMMPEKSQNKKMGIK